MIVTNVSYILTYLFKEGNFVSDLVNRATSTDDINQKKEVVACLFEVISLSKMQGNPQ